MSNATLIGSLQGRLAGHLAAGLANYLVQKDSVKKGDSFNHSFLTDFKFADSALQAIGIFLPQKQVDGRTIPVFVVNEEEMPDFLAMHENNPNIIKLLEAFVRIACGYGYLSDRRDWFDPPQRWKAAMRYISFAGYAESRGDSFRWTDKIGPIMRSNYLWNDENQSVDTLAEIEKNAEVELAWKTMPDTLQKALRSSRIGIFELAKILALSWKGERWHDFNQDQPFEISGQIQLASALIECAQRS